MSQPPPQESGQTTGCCSAFSLFPFIPSRAALFCPPDLQDPVSEGRLVCPSLSSFSSSFQRECSLVFLWLASVDIDTSGGQSLKTEGWQNVLSLSPGTEGDLLSQTAAICCVLTKSATRCVVSRLDMCGLIQQLRRWASVVPLHRWENRGYKCFAKATRLLKFIRCLTIVLSESQDPAVTTILRRPPCLPG